MSKPKRVKINKNKMKFRIGIAILIFMLMSIGVIYGANIYKGDINGDNVVDYADVSLLELHLINSKMLSNDKIKNADMNGDGKLTVTDLSLMIQKIEKKLDYNVEILNINPNTYYPEKNSELVLSFEADVSYGGIINTVVINNNRYSTKMNNETGLYEIAFNVGNTSGVKNYHFTSVQLRSGQEIEIDYMLQVDVLKDIPTIKDYAVTDELDKLKISFNLEDNDLAITSAHYSITEVATENVDENVESKAEENDTNQYEGQLNIGKNEIEFIASENKKYKLSFCIEYDLDSNELQNDTNHKNVMNIDKELELVKNYDFELTEVSTYRDNDGNLEAKTEFYKNERIVVRFNNSVNTTGFEPDYVVINGQNCKLIKIEDTTVYETGIDGFEDIGNCELSIEKIILDNGKVIEVTNKIPLLITKSVPTVDRTISRKNLQEMTFNSMVYLSDIDETITKITVSLYDENDRVIAENVDYTEQLRDCIENNDEVYILNVELNIADFLMADKYKFKIFADYCLIENDETHTYKNKIIYDETYDTSPVVNIKNVSVSNRYPEKNENIVVTYEIETNKNSLPITGIMVNNTRCIPTKEVDENGKVTYEVVLGVGKKAGILNLETSEFVFEGNLLANVSNTIQVDVLKDRPTSEAFTQVDDISNGKGKVTLTANVKDPDGALISGRAELVEVGKENEPVSPDRIKVFGKDNFTFEIDNLELNTEYKLIARMTYDRDSDKDNGLNSVVDEIFRERQIQLIADYNLEISNIKTYSEQKETKYFAKNEDIFVGFNSTNSTAFYPQKAVINGEEYDLVKIGEEYRATLPGYERFGPQDIVIERIILNNTRELVLDRNNRTKVGILKDIPTVSNFGYAEAEDDTINVSFKINDEENTIERRNCYSI